MGQQSHQMKARGVYFGTRADPARPSAALTAYDQAEMTSIAASHIAYELLALIAKSGE